MWIGDFELIGDGPKDDHKTAFIILLVNFLILLFILNRLLFRNLRSSNAEVSDTIRLELQKATDARAAAEGLVREYEAKLTSLD
ncbi:MAG: ATP synthase F0 subunit B, partial [Richelia sp. SM2_1_7]|nr:ATP synthase F0 subunit B [Richelia sp. SM2_1_7]